MVSLRSERVESPPPGAAAAKTDGEPSVRRLWAGSGAARPRDRRVSSAERTLRADSSLKAKAGGDGVRPGS